MIVLYIKNNRQFLQAITGYQHVDEIDGKLMLGNIVLINDLDKAGYFYCEDRKIEPNLVWDEEVSAITETTQTIDELSLEAYKTSELEQVVDYNTGKKINSTIHPHCGEDEQLGILRDQLVQIINALGLEPTADFVRLNEIAIAEIEASAAKKGAL